MATFGSLNSATTSSTTYIGTGGFDLVNYYQPRYNYSITYDTPNNKVFVRNTQNGVIDTLVGISEIYFNGTYPDILLTPMVPSFNCPANKTFSNIYLSSGPQTVTLDSWATVIVGQGNETIINNQFPSNRSLGSVAFWNQTKACTVDLETGVATTGEGYKVTIKNIYQIHFNGANGDTGYGSSGADTFSFDNMTSGNSASVDGRGGQDTAEFYSGLFSEFKISTTVDGQFTTVQRNGYTVHLTNVEALVFRQNGTQNMSFNSKDFIDFNSVGPQTLLGSKALWQNTLKSQGNQLTFSFMSAEPTYGGAEGGKGFTAATDSYKTAVRSILSHLSQTIGINFTEVSDSATSYGQLRFGANQQLATKGYSFNPSDTSTDKAGDVWLDIDTLALMNPGQEGYQVLLHEIGHALGLIHPQGENEPGAGTVLLSQWNNNYYTVMSDTAASNHLWQTWYGPLDIQALQSLYGARAGFADASSNVYALKDLDGQKISTISSSSAIDTLDCSALSLGVTVSLMPNSFSSVGLTRDDLAALNNIYIDSSTSIQKVYGTSYDDVLIGNMLNNTFYPLDGNDLIDGKSGVNKVVLPRPSSAYIWSINAGNQHLNIDDRAQKLGTKDLVNVQRVSFSDTNYAFDLNPSDSAGKTAELLGAAFGVSALANKQFVGIGLGLFDAGKSLQDVAALAIQTGLVSAPDNTSFVKAVWNNVIGSPIDDANLNTYVSQLNKGSVSQSGLLAMAATSSFNNTHINLVGLAQSGLEYQ